MTVAIENLITPNNVAPPVGPAQLLTSREGVTAVAHFYRGEISRMISWRDRLDVTTNWAIGAVAAMLSISLSSPDSHHAVLLFAMLIVYVLLVIEARRYRFFHVYRRRVRMLERYYFAQLFAPTPGANPAQWLAEIAEDLRVPKFTISLRQAMARRIRRSYGWIFLLLLLAWSLKTTSALLQPRGDAGVIHSSTEFMSNAGIPGIPGWIVLGCVVALYGGLAFVAFRYRISDVDLGPGHVHV